MLNNIAMTRRDRDMMADGISDDAITIATNLMASIL